MEGGALEPSSSRLQLFIQFVARQVSVLQLSEPGHTSGTAFVSYESPSVTLFLSVTQHVISASGM